MEFIRVKAYYQDGRFTGCEQLYIGNDQSKVLSRFHREYPEYNGCIEVAEYYNSEDPKNKEHFESCSKCGCVHYW